MKKLLLTLGSIGTIATPLATVVACGNKNISDEIRVSFDENNSEMTVVNIILDDAADAQGFEDLVTAIRTELIIETFWGTATVLNLKGKIAGKTFDRVIDVSMVKDNANTNDTDFLTVQCVLNHVYTPVDHWTADAIRGKKFFETGTCGRDDIATESKTF